MQAGVGLLDTDVMPIFMIIALNIVITLHFSINCLTVICSPIVEFAILREATSETYGPRVYSHHINLHHFNLALPFTLLLLFTLHLYTKNTKNIISIRSHSRK